MKKCPFCAEDIQDAAVVCKHCRRDLPSLPQTSTGRVPGIVLDETLGQRPEPTRPAVVTSTPGSAVKKNWGIGCLGALGVLVVLVGVLAVIGSLSSPSTPPDASTPTSSTPQLMTPGPSRSPSTTPPAAVPTPASWKLVNDWHGSGIKQTETFTVSSREWRVGWQTSNEAFKGAGILQIFVYDENGTLVTLAANKQGIGSDTSYVRGTPGRYYLMINSGNVDWSVVVEDQR